MGTWHVADDHQEVTRRECWHKSHCREASYCGTVARLVASTMFIDTHPSVSRKCRRAKNQASTVDGG